VAVIAYADDVTIFLTAPEDVEALRQVLRSYEQATGAKVNVTKSQALVDGRWDKARPVLEIPYCKELKVLGFRMSVTLELSMHTSWARVVENVSMTSKEAYTRVLLLSQRIVCTYISVSTHIAYGTGFSVTACLRPAPDGGDCMFFMAWSNLSGAAFNVATSEGRRGLGTAGRGGQMQGELISPMATRADG
jgi:hypothetical protein